MNDIVIHPRDPNQIISCSTDGTVKMFNLLKLPTDLPVGGRGGQHGHGMQSSMMTTIISDIASIQHLDIDDDSCLLLAMSEIGQVWKVMI